MYGGTVALFLRHLPYKDGQIIPAQNGAVGHAEIIVLEGVDGAGKSSQARAVAAHLRTAGLTVVEPTRDPTRRLRQVYKKLIAESDGFPSPETSVFLGLSDYADAVDRSRQERCNVRLFERYCYSAIADGIALGMDAERTAYLAHLFPDPLVTLFIDLDAELALSRKGSCTLAEAGGPDYTRRYPTLEASFVAYQEAVRAAYRYLGQTGAISNLAIIDGSRGFEKVTELILFEIQKALPFQLAA